MSKDESIDSTISVKTNQHEHCSTICAAGGSTCSIFYQENEHGIKTNSTISYRRSIKTK